MTHSIRATSYPEVAFVRGLLVNPDLTDLTPDGDLVWLGPSNGDGYPYVRYEGRMIGVHRLVFRVLVGDLAPREPVHHRCGVRACVLPGHLQRATHAANSLEMLARRGYEARLARMDEVLVDLAADLRGDLEVLLDRIAHVEDRSSRLAEALRHLDPGHPILTPN